MSEDRFPYNLPSHEATVRLINDTYPRANMLPKLTRFETPTSVPIEGEPGRSHIAVTNLRTGKRNEYYYRRLDIGVTFTDGMEIYVDGPITPRSIVEEINRAYEMNFGPDDLLMSNNQLVPLGSGVVYQMRAYARSLVWYGDVVVVANPSVMPTNVRLLENGTARLLEEGTYRLLE